MSARARIELTEGGTPVAAKYGSKVDEDAHLARSLLVEARTLRREIAGNEAALEHIVQQLRSIGASWSVIGAAMGTSRAAAHKRFAGRELTR